MSQLTIFHCKHCGGLIPEGRTDKKYCKNACKQANYRWRSQIKRYNRNVALNINQIAKYLEYPETRHASMQYLTAIIKYVIDTGRINGVIIKVVK